MNQAIRASIAAVAALMLSGGAFAQNNTLATPSVVSPAAAKPASPAMPASSDVGTLTMPQQGGSMPMASPDPLANPPGSHNTLATPSTKPPQ
jgi:hypothetical protein